MEMRCIECKEVAKIMIPEIIRLDREVLGRYLWGRRCDGGKSSFKVYSTTSAEVSFKFTKEYLGTSRINYLFINLAKFKGEEEISVEFQIGLFDGEGKEWTWSSLDKLNGNDFPISLTSLDSIPFLCRVILSFGYVLWKEEDNNESFRYSLFRYIFSHFGFIFFKEPRNKRCVYQRTIDHRHNPKKYGIRL